MRWAFVPSVPFTAPPSNEGADYTRPESWLSRPGLASDPSRWLPAVVQPVDGSIPVFFIPPTTSLDRDHWNAPIADSEAHERARLFASSQASVFTGIGQVWAPRYRQATIGALLTTQREAALALDFAYRDVVRAFDAFLTEIPKDAPFILAGHSQGSLHLTRLLAERIAGTPLAARVIAAYPIGWPISVSADLPRLRLPACSGPEQANCILTYQSFADPADPRQILDIYDATQGLTGKPRRGTPMLCVNPLTGAPGSAPAAADRNPGSLVPSADFKSGELVRARVPAACDARGLLLVGQDPEGFGRFVLPGNNYHVFDYALFWAALRSDVARRTAAFAAR